MTRAAGASLALLACAEGASPTPASLPPLPTCSAVITPDDGFVIAGPEDDPFADRPEAPRCLEWAVHPEDLVGERALSIATGPCPYVTATAPLPLDVPAGTRLEARFFHFALDAAAPAEAHAAVHLGPAALIDARVPIPAESGMLQATWTAPSDLASGTPVYVHVHNHGANSWAFLGIRTACE